MSFIKENRFTLIGVPVFGILACVFIGISYSIGNSVLSNMKPTSLYSDWNGRTNVSFTKSIINQWIWTYKNDNSRFIQSCRTWKHDSLFYAEDQLVSYFDNKLLTGRSTSYLKNYRGDIMYEIETGGIWETIINMNKISVSYLIYNNKSVLVGYVDGISFISDHFKVKNVNGDISFSIYRNRLTLDSWVWTFTSMPYNRFPLSLAVGIASRISFNNDNTDLCNNLFQKSYICMFVFIALFTGWCLFCIGLYLQNICKKNRRI